MPEIGTAESVSGSGAFCDTSGQRCDPLPAYGRVMTTDWPRTRQRGQGTVEYIGVVVLVALLVTGITLWLRTAIPDGPVSPPVALTQPLERLVDPLRPPPPPKKGRGFWRSVGHGVRVAARTPVLLYRGFRDRVKQNLKDFIDDPLGSLRSGGNGLFALARDPIGVTQEILDAARGYADELQALGPEKAYERLVYDLGGAAGDAAFDRGASKARRELLKAVRRRYEKAQRDETDRE